ncbi:MAG: hypothetical protein CO088_00730 [Candidatus Yonathbacteria bacterium CG_4_9_14_0_8_um_filter_46_47]|uniref:Uncharacterized protein n=2 Tax=Parcubacteria group TaxID=1794811 RepID=A0A2M8D9I4_9BACT|nr:MAG: hypothetical protein AUJ44_02985 [Candidatus Nomurabacteria bacterium CG1_02_47_685]PIP03959.1 MAG: hypothetical protein COX54_01530 [Candidatus Yonathbacteria bacterium CG23_combo_of_CG06-09_8_20_14_all_46_18]PIY57429.1 MAG: hypothetical protein COY99_03340 [Candidatus Yonathbacteria bacterium CG_4_10_14_0_8_um_filter_47_645]PJB83788.1 MAG: hypothetical protein CO088_00730 [Candidatus Yonathbacteria bacterium CG_4_9_14_0_8_um_filter_46_47]PJC20196.1 MAG: hypothetical protein CO061_0337
MVTEELRAYIKQQLDNGTSEGEIKNALRSQGGWNDADIVEAMQQLVLNNRPMGTPPSINKTATMSSPQNSGQRLFSRPTPGVGSVLAGSLSTRGKGSGFRATIGVIAIIIGVVLVGGSAFAYFAFFGKKSMTPAEVLMAAFNKNMDSATFSVTLSADGIMEQAVTGTSAMDSAAETPFIDPSSFGKITYSAKLTTDGALAKRSGDVQDADLRTSNDFEIDETIGMFPAHFELNFDFLSVNNSGYFRLNDVSDIPFINVSNMKDTWIVFNTADFVASQIEDENMDIESPSITPSFDVESVRKDVRVMVVDYLLSSEFQQIIERSITALDDEVIDGVPLHHYRIALSTDDATILVNEFEKMVNTVREKHLDVPADDSIEPMTDEEKTVIAQVLSLVETNVWVGTDNLYIYRVKTVAEMGQFSIAGADVSGSVQIEYVLKEVNGNVSIEAPKDAITTEELQKLLMQEVTIPTSTMSTGVFAPNPY